MSKRHRYFTKKSSKIGGILSIVVGVVIFCVIYLFIWIYSLDPYSPMILFYQISICTLMGITSVYFGIWNLLRVSPKLEENATYRSGDEYKIVPRKYILRNYMISYTISGFILLVFLIFFLAMLFSQDFFVGLSLGNQILLGIIGVGVLIAIILLLRVSIRAYREYNKIEDYS